MRPPWLKLDLDRWEGIALFLSVLLLFPFVKDILFWMGLPNLFSPFFAVREALYTLTELRIQRDELLKSKGEIRLVNPLDTVTYLPVSFKGRCKLLDMHPPAYPERLTVRCDTLPSSGDILWAVGLIGRITTTIGNTAEVLTLHSGDFYIRVIDLRSGVWGTLKGGRIPVVRFIPEVADVKVGDTLVAYDHPGVMVGVVERTVPEEPFLKLEVKPLWRYYLWTDFALLKPLY